MARKDREAFNKLINPLLESGAVEDVPLGDTCPVASPAFIV